MAIIQWDMPIQIVTPFGILRLNEDLGNGRKYLVDKDGSVARRGIRAVTDMIPQGDGEIFHDRFSTGFEIQFNVQLWENEEPACDAGLLQMYDDLRGHLWSLLRPKDDGGRVVWDPPGAPAPRLLDAVRLQRLDDPEFTDEGATQIKFVLDSPFPYAIGAAQTVENVTAAETLPNIGNVPFYPVIKVNGPVTVFTITNHDQGKAYRYDGARPGAQAIGGGNYAEIDMFRGGIIYLNGAGANLKAGIDVEVSDILTIDPGGDQFSVSGTNADFLLNPAYA